MLKKRKDGQLVKMNSLFKIIPLIMEERSDAQVWFKEEISIQGIDEYIKKKQDQGIKLGYMHVFYAALVRTMLVKPQLNQFVMKGRLYRRNAITVSLAIKKDMTIDGDETTIKIDFKGDETPEKIKEILNAHIEKERKDSEQTNEMDMFVSVLNKIPQGLLRYFIKLMKFLDNNNFMPYSIIKVSPFHTSAFVTNMGSLGIDAINHHIYNFGTVGIFLAIGKKGRRIIEKKGELIEEKTISIGLVSDERICDGFYFASALKQFFRYLKKPELLDEEIKAVEEELAIN